MADNQLICVALPRLLALWQDKTPEFVRRWVRQHVLDAAAQGKPLLLEEFGKWGSGAQRAERDQYFSLIYGEVAAVRGGRGQSTVGSVDWRGHGKGMGQEWPAGAACEGWRPGPASKAAVPGVIAGLRASACFCTAPFLLPCCSAPAARCRRARWQEGRPRAQCSGSGTTRGSGRLRRRAAPSMASLVRLAAAVAAARACTRS